MSSLVGIGVNCPASGPQKQQRQQEAGQVGGTAWAPGLPSSALGGWRGHCGSLKGWGPLLFPLDLSVVW